LRTSATSRKRKAGESDLEAESSSLSKLRKTGDSTRQLRLETKRNARGIFFPEAAERSLQRAQTRSHIGTCGDLATGASSLSLPDQTHPRAGWQKVDIVWHSFKTPPGSDEEDIFAEASSPSTSQQPTLRADSVIGTRAAPRLPLSPEETPREPPLPLPGWQHLLGRHETHNLQPLQSLAIPQPIQTGASGQLNLCAPHPALPTSPRSTSAGHPAEDPSLGELEDREIDEHKTHDAPVQSSQQPAQTEPQKKKRKKKKKQQKQQLPLPANNGTDFTRKRKKARAR
jgi:hypothetical protein